MDKDEYSNYGKRYMISGISYIIHTLSSPKLMAILLFLYRYLTRIIHSKRKIVFSLLDHVFDELV